MSKSVGVEERSMPLTDPGMAGQGRSGVDPVVGLVCLRFRLLPGNSGRAQCGDLLDCMAQDFLELGLDDRKLQYLCAGMLLTFSTSRVTYRISRPPCK